MTNSNSIHIPANAHIFQKRSSMKTTLERMMTFHQDPKALGILTPPPIFMQMHRDERTSITSGELEFTLWFVFIPVRWIAQHQPGPTSTSFADMQIKGPLAYWRHEHIFEQTTEGVILTDRITLAHRPGIQGILTRLMFDGLPLQLLFFYRHLRTRLTVEHKR